MKKSIYLFNNGFLRRKANTLCFEKKLEKGVEKKYIPIENVREIYLFGEITVNSKTLNFLSQKEILVHYFNYYGYYGGTFYPREHYNSGYMILKQAEHYLDQNKRICLARRFVQGALTNMEKVLLYYQRRGVCVEEGIEKLHEFKKKSQNVFQVEELMGIEGNARQSYYKMFDKILREKEEFLFEKRTKQPPKNRLNALISFGNSILYTKILGEIYKTHLDPRIGFLHTTNFRRFTLNLDIAEVFKPVIVDRTIFRLINRGMLKKKHFDQKLDKVVLNDKGRKIFLQEMEEKLKETVKHKKLNRHVAYHELFRMESYKIEKHLIGETFYSPYVLPW